MFTCHASMPALSPSALRRFDMAHHALLAVASSAMAWLLGPGGLMPALASAGGVLAVHLVADAALQHWARRRGLRLIPRRVWRAVWRDAIYSASLPSIVVRSLLFGLAMAQLAQGRPAWALDSNGWAASAIAAAFWFFFGLWNRGSAAADAWAAKNSKTAPEP